MLWSVIEKRKAGAMFMCSLIEWYGVLVGA